MFLALQRERGALLNQRFCPALRGSILMRQVICRHACVGEAAGGITSSVSSSKRGSDNLHPEVGQFIRPCSYYDSELPAKLDGNAVEYPGRGVLAGRHPYSEMYLGKGDTQTCW